MSITTTANAPLPPNLYAQRRKAIVQPKKPHGTTWIFRHRHGVTDARYFFSDDHAEIKWGSGYIYRYDNFGSWWFVWLMNQSHPTKALVEAGLGDWRADGETSLRRPQTIRHGTKLSGFSGSGDLHFTR